MFLGVNQRSVLPLLPMQDAFLCDDVEESVLIPPGEERRLCVHFWPSSAGDWHVDMVLQDEGNPQEQEMVHISGVSYHPALKELPKHTASPVGEVEDAVAPAPVSAALHEAALVVLPEIAIYSLGSLQMPFPSV